MTPPKRSTRWQPVASRRTTRRGRRSARGGHAAALVLDAINILLNVHGAGSFAESNRMQQYRRDANAIGRHPGLNAMIGYEIYGKALLGVEEHVGRLV
jgi:3-hydroxy-9,10-secoandrosta-1,3,5(10)-triene-9,17-dione monooxygenase